MSNEPGYLKPEVPLEELLINIREDRRQESENQTQQRVWSLEEIDKLLGIEHVKPTPPPAPKPVKIAEPETPVSTESEKSTDDDVDAIQQRFEAFISSVSAEEEKLYSYDPEALFDEWQSEASAVADEPVYSPEIPIEGEIIYLDDDDDDDEIKAPVSEADDIAEKPEEYEIEAPVSEADDIAEEPTEYEIEAPILETDDIVEESEDDDDVKIYVPQVKAQKSSFEDMLAEPAPQVQAPPDFFGFAEVSVELSEEKEEKEEEEKADSSTYESTTQVIEIPSTRVTGDEQPNEPHVPQRLEYYAFDSINLDIDASSYFPQIIDEEEPPEPEIPEAQAFSPTADLPEEEPAGFRFEPDGEIVIEDPSIEEPIPETEKTIVFNVDDHRPTVIVGGGENRVVFERPGIVIGKNMFDKTADLRALPAIMPADEMLKESYFAGEKTFVRTGAAPIIKPVDSDELEGQIILPGFNEPEKVEKVDEADVEDELRRSRQKVIRDFKLTEQPDSQDDDILPDINPFAEDIEPPLERQSKARHFSAVKTRVRLNNQKLEYEKPSDRSNVMSFILKKRNQSLFGLVAAGLGAFLLTLLTSVSSITTAVNSASPEALGGLPLTYVISIVVLIIASLIAAPSYIGGITVFFRGGGKSNADTPVFIAVAVALLQNLVAIIFGGTELVNLYSSAALAVAAISAAGKFCVYSRTLANFEFLISRSREGLFSVLTVDDPNLIKNATRDFILGDTDLRYSCKTRFASRFLAYSLSTDSADDICAYLTPIVLAGSVLIAVICGFIKQDVMWAFSIFSGSLCIGAPAAAVLTSNFPLSAINKKLREKGAIISGYASAFEYETTGAVSLEAGELFNSSKCSIHGMKLYHGMSVEDAILFTASMVVPNGGPLGGLFNEVIMSRKEILWHIEEQTYEDRLGLSGWVHGRRVFVGNRKLLEHHNIEIPPECDESRYKRENRRVLYLAVAGKIAAIFVIGYGVDPQVAESLRKIESNGINILVRTTDANITESMIADCFGMPINSVKVVGNVSAAMLSECAEKVHGKTDAKIMHNGSVAALLDAIYSAGVLCSTAGLVSALQIISASIGLLVIAIIAFFSSPEKIGAMQIIIFQLVWTTVGILFPITKRD